MFGQKPSTMTSMLDRLERDGWLVRAQREEDRRSFSVRLTPAGKREASRIRAAIRAFEMLIRRRVSAGDFEGFGRVMVAIDHASGVQVRREKRP